MRNLVREHRVEEQLTQSELGDAVGVSRQTVIAIEHGRYLPSLPLALALARRFHTTVEELFIEERRTVRRPVTSQGAPVRRRRRVTPVAMMAGGCALTAASAAGGRPYAGVLVVTVVATVGFVVIGRTRTDVGAIVASATDERQKGIDLRATSAVALVMAIVLLTGAVASLAQGRDGQPWLDLCAVAGITYAVALAWFRRR